MILGRSANLVVSSVFKSKQSSKISIFEAIILKQGRRSATKEI